VIARTCCYIGAHNAGRKTNTFIGDLQQGHLKKMLWAQFVFVAPDMQNELNQKQQFFVLLRGSAVQCSVQCFHMAIWASSSSRARRSL
jgi:uncharacterized membrane protein